MKWTKKDPWVWQGVVVRGVFNRPSLGAVLMGLIPFAAICFPVVLWDRVYPMVCGLPFNFFWLLCWLVLTPLCMWGAYRLEMSRSPQVPGNVKGGAR